MTVTVTATDQPAISPDDRRHGTVAGWVAGCRANCCRTAAYTWKNQRRRLKAYGRWNPWVDAQPVRNHLKMLSKHGIGWKRAADLAGLPARTVGDLLYPTSTTGKPTTKCRPETAAAILAVQPALDNVADRAIIDGTGTIRRLRALVALGHNQQHLAERLGLHLEAAGRIVRGNTRVAAYVARATRTLYDELSTVRPVGPYAERCRRMAARKGWVPPLAWDEDTIDDPNAKPNLGGPADKNGYDETTVALACDGRLTHAQLAAHQPDLVETVRRLARRLTDQQIADHLRWPGADTPVGTNDRDRRTRGQAAVCALRKREHIPGTAPIRAVCPRDRRRTTKAA